MVIIMFKNKEDLIRFEKKIYDIFETGDLPFLMHLSGGNENELIDIFKNISEDDYVFSTHRSHYHFLLKGGKEEELEEKIRHGNSMFVFDRKLKFFTSSILAGTCGIAAGVALALKLKKSNQKVWCFIGDGAEDEGHFYEAVRFVDSNELPCFFIIEDNDRSVSSSKEDRMNTNVIQWPSCVIRYEYKSSFPHCGTGTKNRIIFNESAILKYRENL